MEHVPDYLPGVSDRVLILGATGWFGKTTLELLGPTNTNILSFPRSSTEGDAHQNSTQTGLEEEVLNFQPSFLIDFSFLTRDKLSTMELSQFESTNQGLTERMLYLAKLPSVQKVLYVSSGAAIHPRDALETDFKVNPYGFLKRRAELQLEELVELEKGKKSVSILRPWSVSGRHVGDASKYLFSSLVSQALAGEIVLQASHPVYRRYVSVKDAINMGLANFRQGETSVLDTGGELIEARDLATLVRDVVNPSASILKSDHFSDEADMYYSDNSSWTSALREYQYEPLSLVQQIEAVADSI
jgi:nucleoside-diphosphate-sugar epimerase